MSMKKGKIMIVSIVTFIIFIMSSVCSTSNVLIANALEENLTDNNMVVNIPDKNLKDLIKNGLKITTDEITIKDMKKVFSINATDIEINSIEGLQYCTDLEFLFVNKGRLSDLNPISSLTKLHYLELRNCNVKTFAAIAKLNSLQNLQCENLKLNDYSDLKSLKSITYLQLDNCGLKDMSFISNLPNLEYVLLQNNYIEEIKGVEGLKKLQALYLNNNEIKDISPLINIPKHTKDENGLGLDEGNISLSENLIGNESDNKSDDVKEKLKSKGFEVSYSEYSAKRDMHLMKVNGKRYISSENYNLNSNSELVLEFTKDVKLLNDNMFMNFYDDSYNKINGYSVNCNKNILTIKFNKNIEEGKRYWSGLDKYTVEGLNITYINVVGYEKSNDEDIIKIPGDINNDGEVDIKDLTLIASDYNKMKSNSTDWNEDKDCIIDGIIDIYDLCFVSGKL